MRSYYKPGVWNAICDVCGFKFKSDQLQQRWDGFMVCKKDYEMRHPQDLLRVPREKISVPWSRPGGEDVFINPGNPLSSENDEFLFTETQGILLTET